MTITNIPSPLITWNTDENGVRQATLESNEEIKIVNNIAQLNYKPNEYHRVTLNNITIGLDTIEFVEIDKSEKIDAVNKYKVDYNSGIIYFHPNLEGFTLTVSQYYNEGLYRYHVSRIYYKDANDVLHTLDEVLDAITDIAYGLQTEIKILNIYDTLAELEIAHPSGNTGDIYAIGTEENNVLYTWSNELDRWFSIGSLKGNKGDKGDTGNTGASPNITIGTVTTGAAGSGASVTITGTTPNLVLNLTIPRGDTGASGASSWSEITGKPTASVTDIDNSATQLKNKTVVTTLGADDTTIPTSKAVSDEIGILSDKIENGIVLSPSITMGMNSVIRKTDYISCLPKFTLQGKSYVNLLGKDGDCEDVSKWYSYQTTLSLDSTKKAVGSNAIKITLTASAGNMNKALSSYNFDVSKYYLLSAFLDKGNSASISLVKNNTGGGTFKSVSSTSTTPTRVGIKLQPSDNNAGNGLNITVSGSSGQYAFVDGIMLSEISASDYVLTEAQLMEKYPYVDSYACLQNPYIEVRHDNLVRNGNCEEGIGWWSAPTGASTLTIENGKFKFATSTQYALTEQIIKVKKNTNYYIKGNISGTGASFLVYGIKDGVGTFITSANSSFNTGEYTDISVRVQNQYNGSTTIYFDSIMLVEGTTAPASYKPCRIERCVIEGKFTSDDTVTYENGEVSGLLNWKHRTLYGKDYDWQYSADFAGYKQLSTALTGIAGLPAWSRNTTVSVKYDGKILKPSDVLMASDMSEVNSSSYTLTVSDADSGWAETINPNADEVKAFMNGWKAFHSNGTRYDLFVSVLTSSAGTDLAAYPAGTATKLTVATTGTTSVTVADASMFKTGDAIAVIGNASTTISSIVGNVLTLAASQSSQAIGTVVARLDTPATDTRILTYCKNNIAPGYEGYQLHYKLANPEPITDANVHVHGDIPKLDNGDNYLYVDSGMALGEVANITPSDGTYRYINTTISSTEYHLKYRVEKISAVLKNILSDLSWTNISFASQSGFEKYGNEYVRTLETNYDTNAIYTVDYQILKTMHTTPTAITMQYQQDVLSAVADLAEGLNSRQKADSALDGLVDLSVYERFDLLYILGRAVQISAVDCRVFMRFAPIPKKCVPIATVRLVSAGYYDGAGATQPIPSADIVLGVAQLTTNFLVIRASYVGSNSTIRTACLNYGMNVAVGLELDCRGRLV